MSNRRLVLAKRAQTDLREILQHTEASWGIPKRIEMGRSILARLTHLLDYPELGRSRDELRAGARSIVVHEYIVIYIVTPTTVRILRMIHSRRDPSKLAGL